MQNKTGTPVRSDDFLRRDAETKGLWHLATRGHVLLLAPRRVGKTSLLHHLEDHPETGWNCIFFSTEALATEAQFVARLLKKLSEAHPGGARWARLGVGLRKLLQGIGKAEAGPVEVNLAEALKDDWRDVGATALKVMQELPVNTLVLVDEFPTFVRNLLGRPATPEGKRRAQLFLDWFREARNSQGKSNARRIYFVLTGSLGLDAVVKVVGLSSTVNDLSPFSLGPLNSGEARELLRKLSLGEGLPLTDSIQAKILEYIDWPIPFHLQLLFSEILNRSKFKGRAVDESIVTESYERLLSSDHYLQFSHWEERLEDPFEMPQERDLKKAILRAAARDKHGVGMASIAQMRRKYAPHRDATAVLLDLEHNGYLTHDINNQRWRFASSLLRDWWHTWQLKET